MRFVQPVVLLLGVAMYITVFAFFYQLTRGDTVQWNFVIAGIWNLLMLVATVIAIVDSTRRIRTGKTRQLATDVLVVKLVSIPFFVLNSLMLAFLFLGGAAIFIFGGFALLAAGAIGSVLTYLAILSTSVSAWATIAKLRRERIIGTALTVVYTILLFVPVADIVAGVLLFGHSRRRPRLALIVLLLATGLVTIAVGILGHLSFLGLLYGPAAPDFDPLAFVWISIIIVGSLVVVATVIVSILRQGSLRSEQPSRLMRRLRAAHPIWCLLADSPCVPAAQRPCVVGWAGSALPQTGRCRAGEPIL